MRTRRITTECLINDTPILSKRAALTVTALVIAGIGLCFGACSKEAPIAEAAQRSYEVRGLVRGAPDATDRSVMIEHEDIPGFMPSMTMPFEFRDAREVAGVGAGDAVAFTLIVTDQESWISGVRKIDAGMLKLPAKAAKAPIAGKVERVKEGDRLPEFALVDQNGRPIQRDTFAGKPLLMTFIFTRCAIPNFCPLMAQNFRTIHDTIRNDGALNGKVNLLSISFDEHDTPAVLAEYGKKFSEDLDTWRFATGTPDEVQKLTRAFAVQVQPEGGTISHGLATALIGPDGSVRQIWRGNGWQTEEVVTALKNL